jgi:hypothetical protein
MISSSTRRAVLRASLAVAALAAAGCAAPSRGPDARSRRIDFDLWPGTPGAAFGFPLKVVSGSRVISGPIDWKHAITCERL